MNKQLWYIHTVKYYLAIKKEQTTYTCTNMDENMDKNPCGWKKHMTKTVYTVLSPLYEIQE